MEMEMLLSDPSSPESTTEQLNRKPHHHEQDGEFLKTKKNLFFFCHKELNIHNQLNEQSLPGNNAMFFENIHPHGMVFAAQRR